MGLLSRPENAEKFLALCLDASAFGIFIFIRGLLVTDCNLIASPSMDKVIRYEVLTLQQCTKEQTHKASHRIFPFIIIPLFFHVPFAVASPLESPFLRYEKIYTWSFDMGACLRWDEGGREKKLYILHTWSGFVHRLVHISEKKATQQQKSVDGKKKKKYK